MAHKAEDNIQNTEKNIAYKAQVSKLYICDGRRKIEINTEIEKGGYLTDARAITAQAAFLNEERENEKKSNLW